MQAPDLQPLGDRALLATFADGDAVAAQIAGYCAALHASQREYLLDLVPAFNRVCIHYDPLALLRAGMDPAQWATQLAQLPYQPMSSTAVNTHRIPVCYEADCAQDLPDLARQLGISDSALIDLHVSGNYQVAMIGFAPGFPYLTGLPPALQLPRRATPRTAVPAGSVAIAENLCGIYPKRLPGGWHLVGRTPLTLFDPNRPEPCLLQAGDRVQFYAIDHARYEAWPC